MDALIRSAGVTSALCLAGRVGVLVPSSEEIVTFLMVGMALFGFVYAYAERVHVRVDTLHRRLPPGTRRIVEIASHAGAALLCGAVAVNGAQLAWTAFRFNDLSDGLIPIPMWIPMSTVPLGFVLLTLALLRDGVRIAAGRDMQFAVSDKEEALALAADRKA